MIAASRPQGSVNNQITVIFDGFAKEVNRFDPMIKVVFSIHHSADDRIRQMVKAATYKRRVVVVTDDRSIQRDVRAMGAKVIAVTEFLSRCHSKPPRSESNGPNPSADKRISEGQKRRIDNELADIWLKKDQPKSDD